MPAAAADDYDATVFGHFITELREVCASSRVSCLNCHNVLVLVKLYRHTVQIVIDTVKR